MALLTSPNSQSKTSATIPTEKDFSRVKKLEFRTSDKDIPIQFLTPHKPGFSTGPTMEALVEVRKLGARYIQTTGRVLHDAESIVFSWGSAFRPEPYQKYIAWLNNWNAVLRSSNQTASLKALGELAPPSWDTWVECNFPLVAKMDHGSHGRGKRVWKTTDLIKYLRRHKAYDVYQRFFPEITEWRVHIFKDMCLGAMRKIRVNDEPTTDLRPEFNFHRIQIIPKEVMAIAIEATKRVGLDFSGVDVIKDEKSGRYYCLETNSAPGMSLETLKRLYMAIQKEFRR